MSRGEKFLYLDDHATAVVKCRQGSQLKFLRAAMNLPNDESHVIDGGVCAALTANWLAETVLGTLEQWPDSAKWFTGTRDESTAVNLFRMAMLAAGPRQRHYKLYGYSLDDLFEPIGFKLSCVKLDDETGISFQRKFVRLCADHGEFRLGSGIAISVTLERRKPGNKNVAHLVGLYRGHDGHMYFFDPNAGVYRLHDPAAFIATWAGVYEKNDMAVSMSQNTPLSRNGFYTCIPSRRR